VTMMVMKVINVPYWVWDILSRVDITRETLRTSGLPVS